MRTLIISVPSIGHVRSMVPVAKALVDRGHEVYWAANATVAYVTTSGAELVHILPDELSEDNLTIPVRSSRDIDVWFLEEWFIPIAEIALGPTLDCARRLNPDLIVTDATALWGAMTAEALGRSWATYCPGLFMSSQERQLAIRDTQWPQEPMNWAKQVASAPSYWEFERRLNALRRKWGLPASYNLGKVSESLVICFTTRAIEFGGAGLPEHAHCVGPVFGAVGDIDPFADRMPDIPEGEEPLVYVTLGNVFASLEGTVDLILEGLEGLPLRVFVARTRAAIHRPRFSKMRVTYAREPVSQAQVLRQASLVIGSCGFNTLHESLCHGVPVVALPAAHDGPPLARRIEELGFGICLDKAARTPQAIRSAVERILSHQSFAECARTFSMEARIAEGVAKSVRLLEMLGKDGAIRRSDHRKMIEVLPERPKFARRFRLFDTSNNAVVIESYVEDFTFRNESTCEAVRWLWKSLDGKKRLEELLDEWTGKVNLIPIIASLAEKGVIEDNNGASRLSWDAQRYENQITLFSHAHVGVPALHASLRGAEFQEKLSRARVCVVAAGVLGSNVVRNLCLVGIGGVNIVADGVVDAPLIAGAAWYEADQIGLPQLQALANQARSLRSDIEIRTFEMLKIENEAANAGAHVPYLDDVHLLILAQDVFEPATYAQIDEACHARRVQWTSLRRDAMDVEIGPTIVPYQTGCFLCYERRRAGNSRAAHSLVRSHAGHFHMALGPEWVVLEAIKLLTGFGEAVSVGRVMVFDSLTMTLSRHRVFRLPNCVRCVPQPSLPKDIPWRSQQ